MAGPAPQLSSTFDARVMRGVRPRRVSPVGRVVLAIYVVMAAAAAVWLMRDLTVELIGASVAISGIVAVGAGAYGRRLATGS